VEELSRLSRKAVRISCCGNFGVRRFHGEDSRRRSIFYVGLGTWSTPGPFIREQELNAAHSIGEQGVDREMGMNRCTCGSRHIRSGGEGTERMSRYSLCIISTYIGLGAPLKCDLSKLFVT